MRPLRNTNTTNDDGADLLMEAGNITWNGRRSHDSLRDTNTDVEPWRGVDRPRPAPATLLTPSYSTITISPSEADSYGCISCRICMEPCTDGDFEEGTAFRLGCRCKDGLDVVHQTCAQRWFTTQMTTKCEVCDEEARNLPDWLQADIRTKQQRRLVSSSSLSSAGDGQPGQGQLPAQSSTESHPLDTILDDLPFFIRGPQLGRSVGDSAQHLQLYLLCAVVPALVLTCGMAVYYQREAHVSIALTIVLSIMLGVSSIVAWTINYNRPLVHFWFVAVLCTVVLLLTHLLESKLGWMPMSADFLGFMIGYTLSLLCFYGILIPIIVCINKTCKATWQHLRNICTVRRNGPPSAVSTGPNSTQQAQQTSPNHGESIDTPPEPIIIAAIDESAHQPQAQYIY